MVEPDIHEPQFELSKAQVAHDLAIVAMLRRDSGETSPDEILPEYQKLLREFSIFIDDRSRYEHSLRKWNEAVPVGKSRFDNHLLDSEP